MIFVRDTLDEPNGTLLTSRTGEVGAAWTRNTAYGSSAGVWRMYNNGIYPDGDASLYYAAGIPSTNEYDVTATYLYISDTVAVAIGGRCSTNAATLYYVYHNNNEWVFVKSVNGVLSTLDATPQTLSSGTNYILTLELRNSLKRVLLNGSEIMRSTDNQITDAGRVAVRSPTWAYTYEGKQIRYIEANDMRPNIYYIGFSDADKVVGAETYAQVRQNTYNDLDTLLVSEVQLSHSLQSIQDIPLISATEQMVNAILVANDDNAVVNTNVVSVVQSETNLREMDALEITESLTITTTQPPIRNNEFSDAIKQRSATIHDIVQKYVLGHVNVMYYHTGIFEGSLNIVVPSDEFDIELDGVDDRTYFVVVDEVARPQAVGVSYSDWETENVVVAISKDVAGHEALLRQFGIEQAITG